MTATSVTRGPWKGLLGYSHNPYTLCNLFLQHPEPSLVGTLTATQTDQAATGGGEGVLVCVSLPLASHPVVMSQEPVCRGLLTLVLETLTLESEFWQ